MAGELIGKVTVTPEVVVPGQSIFVEVKDANGEAYPVSGETLVRINGIIGAQQYLQFDRAGEQAIFVVAARGNQVETKPVTVQVAEPATPSPALDGDGLRIRALSFYPALQVPPLLQLARSPRQPYVAALSIGREVFRNGLSAGAVPHTLNPNALTAKTSITNALQQPLLLAETEAIASAVNQGLRGSELLHHLHEVEVSPDVLRPHVEVNLGLFDVQDFERLPDTVATPVPGGLTAEPLPTSGDRALTYYWDFGDGTTLTTRELSVEHDFEAALDPDQEHHLFHIKVRIEEANQPSVEVLRTLYVHNAYALCKKLGTIVPKAHSTTFATKALGAWEGSVTIDNIESFPIVLTSRVVFPLMSDGDDLTVPGAEELLPTAIAVPPKGSIVVPIAVSAATVPDGAIGFAVTLCGTAPDGKAIRIETHFDLPAKDRASQSLKIGDLSVKHFQALRSLLETTTQPVTDVPARRSPRLSAAMRQSLFHLTAGAAHLRPASAAADALPMATRAIANRTVLDLVQRETLPSNAGVLTQLTRQANLDLAGQTTFLEKATTHPQRQTWFEQAWSRLAPVPPPVEGEECDPDNAPDNIADDPDTDWVCQSTPETREVITPGRFLNARKGDVVLSPGGPNIIGQLLRQVTPSQRYSHSGIMTRNYDQITHSTASEDRILDYPVGNILGEPAPSNGHRPDVVKYCWPGVVTQTVEQSLNGEEMHDPETGKGYVISGFSRQDAGIEIGGKWEIIHPLVVKPDPRLEGQNPSIRKKLHEVASDAVRQTGKSHYRFYCYTDPTIADDSNQVAPADTGWAAGTYASVCSSFIWHLLKKHGVHLESDQEFVADIDLEASDRASGAEVNATTKDGLYLYTAEERLTAAKYLHQSLMEKVDKKLSKDAGVLAGLADLFSDIKDDVANQIVNTFASDWSDTESKDSDQWKNTVAANAVSPDNILLMWDSPELKGLYGYAAPLLYREPRLETITIHRWRKVQVKGTLTGTVRYNGQPQPGAAIQLYDGKTAFADAQGNYRLDHVPFGNYEAKASSDLAGVYLSAKVPFAMNSSTIRLDIDLKAPSALFRRLKIQGTMHIVDYENWPSDDEVADRSFYRELYVGPFSTHAETTIVESMGGEVRVEYRIVADWHLDKSIGIYYEIRFFEGASEDTDDLDGRLEHSFNLAADSGQGWNSTIDSSDAGSVRIDVNFENVLSPT